MRKICSLLLVLALSCLLILPAVAASEPPEITLQPQSPNYPEYSVAIYTVKATGSNLRAFWYMEWLGKTYCISDIGGAMQPWEPFAGEAYGAKQLDSNTFAFIFEGLEYDLDGAYIWCVIEDGHYDAVSQKARISVGNPNTPPEIIDIPSKVTVQQGQQAEIRCVARSNDGSQLSYLWYETATGKMEDMIAVNRGEETSDYMFPDTSRVGTRYYFCKVDTSNGGMAYSSMVEVKVEEKAVEAQITTDSLPRAVAGSPYSAQISCTDPGAEFSIAYNAGGGNDFSATGLSLSRDGKLTGTPAKAGSYTFCVCALGSTNEDYRVYTLQVDPAPVATTPAATTPAATTPAATAPEATTPGHAAQTTPNLIAPAPGTTPEAAPSKTPTDNGISVPWWGLALVGVLAGGLGAGIVVLATRRKQ